MHTVAGGLKCHADVRWAILVCCRIVDLMKTEKGSCDVDVICIRLLVTIIIYSLSIDITKVCYIQDVSCYHP